MANSSNPTFSSARHVTIADGMGRIPDAQGRRFAQVFEHGSLTVEVYAPRGHDPQKPHTRDEAYIVVNGSGVFVNGDQKMGFAPGD